MPRVVGRGVDRCSWSVVYEELGRGGAKCCGEGGERRGNPQGVAAAERTGWGGRGGWLIESVEK